MTTHIVVDGDCLTSIAAQYGFADADPILNHPDNSALNDSRLDGHQLYPGDQIAIPDREPKVVSLASGKRHKIVVKRPTRLLRVAFLDGDGEPLSGAYKLKAGALEREGSLDGNGVLEKRLPVDVTSAEVELDGVTPPSRATFSFISVLHADGADAPTLALAVNRRAPSQKPSFATLVWSVANRMWMVPSLFRMSGTFFKVALPPGALDNAGGVIVSATTPSVVRIRMSNTP